MRIAIIAHDSRKELMAQFCTAYLRILSENELVATGVTGKIVHDATGLPVRCLYPGGRGGSEQIAAILYRYDTYRGHTPQGSAALDGYADAASVESWAAEAMSWANGNGLVTGVTPTTLVPNGTATRAQVAVILSRYTDQ